MQMFDTGNNAWGMIALLALYRYTGVQQYLDAAKAIAEFHYSTSQRCANIVSHFDPASKCEKTVLRIAALVNNEFSDRFGGVQNTVARRYAYRARSARSMPHALLPSINICILYFKKRLCLPPHRILDSDRYSLFHLGVHPAGKADIPAE